MKISHTLNLLQFSIAFDETQCDLDNLIEYAYFITLENI